MIAIISILFLKQEYNVVFCSGKNCVLGLHNLSYTGNKIYVISKGFWLLAEWHMLSRKFSKFITYLILRKVWMIVYGLRYLISFSSQFYQAWIRGHCLLFIRAHHCILFESNILMLFFCMNNSQSTTFQARKLTDIFNILLINLFS